jgi:tetratricopeptide (TPR) repeat protein
MRVNVQLVDAQCGAHLWAERFDKPIADYFDMQDEIVARLANQLAVELMGSEARRSERAPTPDSFDLFLQGASWFHKGPTSENLAVAQSFFERALALDPDNVEALVKMSMVDFQYAEFLFSDDRAARLAAAEKASIKALRLAPERLEEARAAARTGLALNPGFTVAQFRPSRSSDNARYIAAHELFAEALHAAGAPEE